MKAPKISDPVKQAIAWVLLTVSAVGAITAALLLLASCAVALKPPVYQVKRAHCLNEGIYYYEAFDTVSGNGYGRIRFISREKMPLDTTVNVVFTVKKPAK